MKNEKERMTHYVENLKDIHVKSVEKVAKGLKISLGTLAIIITVIIAIMGILIGSIISVQTQNIFTMNKEQFLQKIEKSYEQKIEVLQDNSVSRRGTGTYILKTKRKPQIEFHAIKSRVRDSYLIDYEERAILYYASQKETALFENIEIEEKQKLHSEYSEFEIIECTLTLKISSYEEIENASRQLYELTNWLKQRLNTLNISPYLKIGEDYTSPVCYLNITLEDALYQEKYQ